MQYKFIKLSTVMHHANTLLYHSATRPFSLRLTGFLPTGWECRGWPSKQVWTVPIIRGPLSPMDIQTRLKTLSSRKLRIRAIKIWEHFPVFTQGVSLPCFCRFILNTKLSKFISVIQLNVFVVYHSLSLLSLLAVVVYIVQSTSFTSTVGKLWRIH